MNTTHQFYTTLSNEQPILFKQLEQLALTITPDEAKTQFSPHVPEEVRETIDYSRLHALLRKNLGGADLVGEDFSGMRLANFTFARAKLREARFVKANLMEANLADADLTGANLTDAYLWSAHLERAHCRYTIARSVSLKHAHLEASQWEMATLTNADLTLALAKHATFEGASLANAKLERAHLPEANFSSISAINSTWCTADLRQATLQSADLTGARLEGANLLGTNLRSIRCSRDSFGEIWLIDENTQFDTGNRILIGMALLSQAQTDAQRNLALYIQGEVHLCWKEFLEYLVREYDHELSVWVKKTLGALECLRGRVDQHELLLEELREKRLAILDSIRCLNPSVAELLIAEAKRQAALSTRALSAYLRGVLAGARQLPKLQLENEQYQLFDDCLKKMIGEQ